VLIFLLVGDSLGQVILGLDTTIEVTLQAVIHHTRAVARGASRALVVADMPFLTYQVTAEEAMQHAARLFQQGLAAAVKLEGGRAVARTVGRLTAAGLPVMRHLGLTPQHLHRLGGMRQQARDEKAQEELINDALALEDAGAFAVSPGGHSGRGCRSRHVQASYPGQSALALGRTAIGKYWSATICLVCLTHLSRPS
jgi:3-methyl-2-oxobutanoate hydroxymethyltransferase